MQKKILTLMTVLSLAVFTLCGCGSKAASTEPTETIETGSTEIAEQASQEEVDTIEQEEVKEEPEQTTEPTEEPTPTETPEQTVEPTQETEPAETSAYTYTDLSVTMYAQQTVNVRTQPSTDGEKVGSLKTNDEVSVTGQCNETGWYRIAYGDGEAYVSNKYLGDSKVEVQQPAQNTPTNSTDNSQNTGTDEPCPVDLYVVHDEGDMVYMWGEFHNRNAGDRSNPAFDQLFNYCVEKWGYNLSGYQDCDNHVWWYHDSFNDSLCRWVFVPSN